MYSFQQPELQIESDSEQPSRQIYHSPEQSPWQTSDQSVDVVGSGVVVVGPVDLIVVVIFVDLVDSVSIAVVVLAGVTAELVVAATVVVISAVVVVADVVVETGIVVVPAVDIAVCVVPVFPVVLVTSVNEVVVVVWLLLGIT